MTNFKTLAIGILAASAVSVGTFAANAASFSGLRHVDVANNLVVKVATASDRAKLRRVLRPHQIDISITRGMRAAAGDPNMVVIDNRGGSSQFFTCSFITLRGKRAMICN